MRTTFGLKKKIRVGFWNVRTLYEVGKLHQAINEMETYKLDVLGMSEVRWNEFGEVKTPSAMTFLFSGRPNANDVRREGVGIILNQKMKKSLSEWFPVLERIIVATFRGKIRNVSIIQCYAPTEQAEESKKDCFYSKLQETYNKIKKKNIKIVMGDLNAKVGRDRTGLEQVIGRHSLEGRNQNGGMLLEWCASNEMVIGGTLFPHKRIHKVWISPDHKTQPQNKTK